MSNSNQTENPFITQYQKYRFEATQLGLEPYSVTRSDMRRIASNRICEEGVTDESGKIKIYEEVKAQFKEYEEWLERETDSKSEDSKSDAEECNTTTATGTSTTRGGDTITVMIDDSQFRKEIVSVLRDFLEHTGKLLGEVKQLDERLKKLEKYTQE